MLLPEELTFLKYLKQAKVRYSSNIHHQFTDNEKKYIWIVECMSCVSFPFQVPLNEYEFPSKKLSNVQSQVSIYMYLLSICVHFAAGSKCAYYNP